LWDCWGAHTAPTDHLLAFGEENGKWKEKGGNEGKIREGEKRMGIGGAMKR